MVLIHYWLVFNLCVTFNMLSLLIKVNALNEVSKAPNIASECTLQLHSFVYALNVLTVYLLTQHVSPALIVCFSPLPSHLPDTTVPTRPLPRATKSLVPASTRRLYNTTSATTAAATPPT